VTVAMASQPQPDLTSCDQEQITRLETIQPFGFLLALSNDWTVARASANVGRFLGVSPDELIGRPLDRWTSEQAVHDIRNRMSILYSTGNERLYGVKLLEAKNARFDLSLHFAGELLILEGEPSQASEGMEAASMVRAMIARLNEARDITAFHRLAARQVRAITGFDRVMIYCFDESGAGLVIAESVKAGVESFLGLHYPASDIPAQARALYMRNPFRIIADVAAAPISLQPAAGGAVQALDLSMAVTRAVSPIHIEYLTNMGVGASLSLSIIVDGSLWGLVACHHESARLPSFVMRTAADLFGQMYAMTLESRLHGQALADEQRTRQVTDRMITAAAANNGLLADVQWLQEIASELIDCDGFALCRSGAVIATGWTPPEEDVGLIAGALNVASPSRVFTTNHLASLHPPCAASAERAAGLLAIPISRIPRDYIMLFRRERIHQIKWGGAPDEALSERDNKVRLSPRKSFAAFAELIRERATPFSERDLRVAENVRLALIEVILRFSEKTLEEGRAAKERQELLIAELNHRVRNILSLIRGLVNQTGDMATDVASYVDGLEARIQALARAHDQITRENWGPGSLTALLDDEIAAHGRDGAKRFFLEGPSVLLHPTAMTTLALVIHELVTNSVKHGALSTGGAVTVTVEMDGEKGGWLKWRERGGPAVTAPMRRGFGAAIVERSVPYDLDGTAAVRFLLTGFEADFFIPIQYMWLQPSARTAALPGPSGTPPAVGDRPAPVAGVMGPLRYLLLEDSLLIALETEDMLNSLGAISVVLASTVAAAEKALTDGSFDFAVLDVNVGRGTSFVFASRLHKLGIPYLFASGYGDAVALAIEHKTSIVVQKPYGREQLGAAIRQVTGRGAPRHAS